MWYVEQICDLPNVIFIVKITLPQNIFWAECSVYFTIRNNHVLKSGPESDTEWAVCDSRMNSHSQCLFNSITEIRKTGGISTQCSQAQKQPPQSFLIFHMACFAQIHLQYASFRIQVLTIALATITTVTLSLIKAGLNQVCSICYKTKGV